MSPSWVEGGRGPVCTGGEGRLGTNRSLDWTPKHTGVVYFEKHFSKAGI